MIIRKCDIISPLITLYYKGETRHSSIFSGCISIIVFILTSIICLYISFDFLFKRNPTSFYYLKKDKNIGIINLTNNYFFHYITFLNKYSKNDLYDNKTFSVIGINNASIYIALDNKLSEYNFSHWKYERCENLNIKYFNISKEEKYFNMSLCLSKYFNNETQSFINYDDENFPYPILENNLDKEYITNYGIIIKRCENNTLYNNNTCYNEKIIENKIYNIDMKYIFNYYSNFIDVNNYSQPIESQLNNITFNFDPYYINKNDINLHRTFIKTSDGFFFGNNKILETYNFDSLINENMLNYFYLIGEMIDIKMLNKAEVYHREYKKFQDIIGNVDGMIELTLIIIEIINNFFYHDYRLINDFNEFIRIKVNKIKSFRGEINNSLSFKNFNSKIMINNYAENTKITKNYLDIKRINTTIRKTNSKIKKTNIDEDYISKIQSSNINNIKNFSTQIMTNFQNLSWFTYMMSNFCCIEKKKFKYPKKVLSLRKKILSEDRLLKNYWKIKILNKGLTNIKMFSDSSFMSLLNEGNKNQIIK